MSQNDIWNEHGQINWDLVGDPSQLHPQALDYGSIAFVLKAIPTVRR